MKQHFELIKKLIKECFLIDVNEQRKFIYENEVFKIIHYKYVNNYAIYFILDSECEIVAELEFNDINNNIILNSHFFDWKCWSGTFEEFLENN
jgi:hypothetical protein